MVRTSGLNREDIKAGLRKLGFPLSLVAKELGVTRQAVTLVLAGTRSERIEKWIAEKLELTPKEVWPERYDTSSLWSKQLTLSDFTSKAEDL